MKTRDNQSNNQVLGVLFAGVLMAALDIAIVGPALSAIQGYFHIDTRAVAWTFTIYVLLNLIGTPLMAKLSDLFGRRTIYVFDVMLFAIGSLIVAISPSFEVLLVGRAVQGLGAGGIFPVASAVIGDTFPPEKRGRALGLIGAVFGIAFVIGPVLGGVLLLLGWQWLFIVNLPIAAIVVVLSLRNLPATRPAAQRRFDLAGMLTLGVALAALAFGINQLDTAQIWTSLVSPNVWPFLLAAIVLIPVFVLIEKRAADPILRLSLFNSRQRILASVLSAGAGIGESGLVFIPPLAVAALGLSKSASSFMLMPVVLAMAFGSPTAGRLLDRLGSKVVVVAGTAILAIGMFLLSGFATSLALFIVAGIVIGVGLSALLGAPVRYIMLNEASASDRSAAQGLITLQTSIGQLIGGALVGSVAASGLNAVAGYESAYLVTAVIAVLLVALSLGLKGHAEERASAPASPAQADGGTAQPAR